MPNRIAAAVSSVSLVLLMFFGSTLVSAQSATTSLRGTVTDPTGAVVPNAQVTAHNTATGVDTQATTNGAGVYNIRFLPIGQYEVTVSATNFTTTRAV